MQTKKQEVPLKKACERFAEGKLSLNTEKEINLYAIFGHWNAGKTITCDLLEGKKLALINDLEKRLVLVRQEDYVQLYPPTLMALHQESIIAESFALQQSSPEEMGQQIVKLVYLEELMKIAERVSFIIVCEEKCMGRLQLHLEQFLGCLGILAIQKDERIQAVSQHVYLLVTKSKEARREQCLKKLAGIKAENENVAELIKSFIKDPRRCKLFPAIQPAPTFANEVFDTFAPKKKSNDLLDILENSCLRKKQPVFAGKDIQYVFDMLISISKMLRNLILYNVSQDKTEHRRAYEAESKIFFFTHKNKRKVQKMAEKWTVDCFPQTMPAGQGSNSMIFLAEWLMQLCSGFETSNIAAQKDFKEWIFMLMFCLKISFWLKIDENTQTRINEQIIFHRTLHQKYSPKPKQKPKEAKKKPYQAFHDSIKQHCTSNLDALQLCFRTIKDKQKQPNFDYFQVIFQLKLLLHLIDCLNSQSPLLFIKELLELSLYLDSSFLLFCSYLETALINQLLDYRESMQLIKQLIARQKSNECLRVINYQAALTIQPQLYSKLQKMKNKVRAYLKHQQVNALDKPQKPTPKALTFSLQSLKTKLRINHLSHLLSSDDFSHFLK